ncbi:sporulation protein YqfD [Clostridioides difficile]|uniref:sporulation protein YqfD n=1 Tax=Clostridioides difficile TaxID=1496 RepID=UPI000873311C|nr:sporulation protein YqfD [Clostridioides difficile]AXU65169.1 stage IV sporulation protein [Clostridioides difficile]EGT4036080.1 sporulation protein YqfD [Clostridioides difficile]EGT5086460.1 sporulation protein YqfD [Clostridioides difficile]EGT5492218.1 sporulation protein YqfD [Clostridioides difficile]EJX3383170.1 sporulation protein YqfD [Clostridioides difficile]
MISFIRGYYVIVVEGVGLEQFLNHLIRNGISVYNVTRIKNTKMEFHIDRQDIKEFKNVYRGSKFDIKVKQKTGVPFIIKRVYKHKGMWICALVSLFLLMSTSQFVTDVYIQSPEGIKKEALRNELYKVGVRPGVYKKSIDRKEVRDHMMSKFNDVAYLSINVKGTNIFVTVTKKAESLKSTDQSNYCNVIALKNGIIEKVIPRSGKSVIKSGDIVQKGDVLLNGANTKSIPEVWASTFYESTKKASYVDTVNKKTGEKKNIYTLSFYDKEFTMRKNIKYKDYVVENKEKKLSIGNYTFPIKIKTSTFYETKKVEVKKNKEELKKELSEKALKELEYIIPASARIIDVKHNFKVNKNMLEYLITVQTSENIAKIYPLSKSEAERFIKEESKPDEGEEEVPSNPEKRPLNDIRNEFDEDNKDNKDQNNSDENNSNQNTNNSQNNNSNNN